MGFLRLLDARLWLWQRHVCRVSATNGFANCYGYDRTTGRLRRSDSQQGPFDAPRCNQLSKKIPMRYCVVGRLSRLVVIILIGTPDAANIDLTQPSVSDYYNAVHVPYHFISTLANP